MFDLLFANPPEHMAARFRFASMADRSDWRCIGKAFVSVDRANRVELRKQLPSSPLQFANLVRTSMAWKSLLKSYRYCDATSCNFRQGIFPPSDTASQGRWRKMLKLAICGCCRTREVCKCAEECQTRLCFILYSVGSCSLRGLGQLCHSNQPEALAESQKVLSG